MAVATRLLQAIVASHADRTEAVRVPGMGDRKGRPYGIYPSCVSF